MLTSPSARFSSIGLELGLLNFEHGADFKIAHKNVSSKNISNRDCFGLAEMLFAMANQDRVSSFGDFVSLHGDLVLLFELIHIGCLYLPDAFGKLRYRSAPF